MLFEVEAEFRIEVDGTFVVREGWRTVVLAIGRLVHIEVRRLWGCGIFNKRLKDGGCPGRTCVDSSVTSDDGTVVGPGRFVRSWWGWRGIFEGRGKVHVERRGALKEFQLDRYEHDVVGVFVGMGDDQFEVAERGLEGDQFTLKHVDGADALKSVFEGVNFGKTGHILFDVAHNLSIVDSFCLEPGPETEEFRSAVRCWVVQHWGT